MAADHELVEQPNPMSLITPIDKAILRLSHVFHLPSLTIREGFSTAQRNVRLILTRQLGHEIGEGPLSCRITGEDEFAQTLLGLSSLVQALFNLARLYEQAHLIICRMMRDTKPEEPSSKDSLKPPHIDVRRFAKDLRRNKEQIHKEILLVPSHTHINEFEAHWNDVHAMNFERLEPLRDLSGYLPGEKAVGATSTQYAGVGGGGGSDVISASLLGLLLKQNRKNMDLLVSTRTWRTGSQGKDGKMGIKRDVRHHAGPAYLYERPVGGTYRVIKGTQSEGRELETIPLRNHEDIFIVLDQGEDKSDVPDEERADLSDQFQTVLSTSPRIDTVIVVDTGGDVFGGNASFSTPDQDIRTQRAMARLTQFYPNLVTAVLCPGVDAPDDAPEKARKAGGKRYQLTDEDKKLLLQCIQDYEMDGSNPDRYGKTTLCLQEALKGNFGWRCIDLPEHVVDTYQNPWSCFVYIRECMTQIIFVDLIKLLMVMEDETNDSDAIGSSK